MSVFNKKYNIETEIELLYSELRTIESIKSMVETQGWQELANWIISRIADLSEDIVDLSVKADKHIEEIKRKRWSISLYETLLNTVGTTLNEAGQKTGKIKHLEEIARVTNTV